MGPHRGGLSVNNPLQAQGAAKKLSSFSKLQDFPPQSAQLEVHTIGALCSPVLAIVLAFALATCERKGHQCKGHGDPGPPSSHMPSLSPIAPAPRLTQGEQDSSDAQERSADRPAQLQGLPV